MDNCKVISTSTILITHMDQEKSNTPIYIAKCWGMIILFLYVTASHHGVIFRVCMCACYQSCPNESYLSYLKRIMKYFKGTTNVDIWYPNSVVYDLVGYIDLDYAGCKIDRNNTSVTCHILGNSLVSWSCKRKARVFS